MEMIVFSKGVPHTMLIDEEDLEKFRSSAFQVRTYGTVKRYVSVGGKYVHRIIMDAPKELQVDHINGNPLDNRKENLRLCSKKQNLQNRRVTSRPSGFKGVRKNVFSKHKESWNARIKLDRKEVHIGCFKTPQEAAIAYDSKAIELFGEFACTNKMLGLLR